VALCEGADCGDRSQVNKRRSNYNYFRDYDAVTGRYVESDPLGLAGGTNPYAYAEGNPLAYGDPYGLWAIGDPLPDWIADPLVGLGDGASFGLTARYRAWRDYGTVDTCSPLYRAADFLGANLLPIGRLGYFARVKSLPRFAGTLESALARSSVRNAIKLEYRGGLFGGRVARAMGYLLGNPMSEAQVVARYGENAALIAQKAAKTSGLFNSAAALATAYQVNRQVEASNDCACQR
jgi:RHS repeat-associated protein